MNYTKANESVIYIENVGVKVGILTEVGGTIVSLQLNNGRSILKSDSALWNEPVSERPKANANPVWKAYNGHTVWLGPQDEWWVHQEINPELKKSKSPWPPDPWLIYSNYSILQHSNNQIVIESPESPVTGIKLTKSISIETSGKVVIKVTAKNIRNTPVSWDIWMNSRMNGLDQVYVPVSNKNNIRIDDASSKTKIQSSIVNGFFTFNPKQPMPNETEAHSKAFIYPKEPLIAGFNNDYLLLVRFEKHAQSEIHPKQALVEIYNSVAPNPKNDLLELEYHAPYKTLLPGETMEAWESWEVSNYTGSHSINEQIEFLKLILK